MIELKRGEESELILNSLYKYTDLQNTFGIIFLALVDNAPRILNLREILQNYLKHRYSVVTRRTKFELDKAEKRAHILEGFKIALDNIDEIIKIIRGSQDGNEAKEKLIESFAFSEVQAKAILDMRLQRLTGLEREKIEEEYKELMLLIEELKSILSDPDKIYAIIKEEVKKIKEDYEAALKPYMKYFRKFLKEKVIKEDANS